MTEVRRTLIGALIMVTGVTALATLPGSSLAAYLVAYIMPAAMVYVNSVAADEPGPWWQMIGLSLLWPLIIVARVVNGRSRGE